MQHHDSRVLYVLAERFHMSGCLFVCFILVYSPFTPKGFVDNYYNIIRYVPITVRVSGMHIVMHSLAIRYLVLNITREASVLSDLCRGEPTRGSIQTGDL